MSKSVNTSQNSQLPDSIPPNSMVTVIPPAISRQDDSPLNPLAECLDKLYPGAQPAFFRKSQFPQHFVFGSATAAFQIEGGLGKHSKGDTTWDKFAKEHDLFKPYGPDAVNHVEKFEEDVKLMKDIGFDAYRF